MKNFFKSALWKDSIKTIKNSLSRFLAIIAMTGLSAAIFIGLQSGVPNLKKVILDKAKDHKMHDIKVSSYTGIRDKDKEIIKNIPGYSNAEYVEKNIFNVKEEEYSVMLFSKTQNIDINVVKKGRMPKKDNEIALDYQHFEKYGDKIGSKISFENEEENGRKLLNVEEFTIVGYVDSIEYINNTRTGGTEGNYFGTVLNEAMNKKYPDLALINLDYKNNYDYSSDEFKLKETKKVDEITKLFDKRPEEVKQEIKKEADDEIADARKELDKGKKEISDGQKELDDAKKELEDAKKEIEKGQKELDDSKVELENGKKELEDGKKQLDDAEVELNSSKKELDDAKKELDAGKAELDSGKAEYNKNKKKYDEEISNAWQEINAGQAKIDAGKAEIQKNENKYLDSLKQYENGLAEITQNKETIDTTLKNLDTEENNLNNKKAELSNKKASLEKNLQSVNDGIDTVKSKIPLGMTREFAEKLGNQELIAAFDKLDELEAKKKEIEQGLQQIEQGLEEISQGFTKISQTREDLDNKLKLLASEEKKIYESKPQLDQAKKELDKAKQDIQAKQEELNASKKILQEKEASGKAELDKAKSKLDAAESDYNKGLKEYQDGLAKYQSGLEEFNSSKEKYNKSLADYKKGQEEYEKGLKELEDAKAKYQDGLKEYEDGKKEFETKSKDANKKIKDAEEDIKDTETRLASLDVPAYGIQGKYGHVGFYTFIDQAISLNYMSYIFSTLFYLVAILVTLTTILRMVENERSQIGTLKALGYSKNNILLKYLSYGLTAALIGSILGIFIGRYVLMPPIVKAYISFTNLKISSFVFEIDKGIIIVIATLSLIGLTVYFTVHKSLRENAASLMRPKPPKKAKRTIFERIPFIWNKLSFLNKVSLRNIFRNKIRMLITIIGVAGSFGLMAMGFGIQTSIKNVAPKQFGEIYNYDAQVIYNDQADDFDDFNKYIKKKTNKYTNLIYEQASVKTPEGFNEQLTVMASDKDISEFITLRNRKSKKNHKLEDGKVIISEKLSKNQELKVGDDLVFKDKDGIEHKIEISAITEQYFNHVAYMSDKTYKNIVDEKAEPNAYLLKLKETDDKSVNEMRKELSDYDASSAFIPIIDLRDTLNDLSDSLNVVIVLVIGVSAMLALVVLYNLTDINISERIREISTIKVLGFRPNEVVSYIFKENILLTVIGIFFGYFVAKIMHGIIVYYLSPGAFQFDPQMMVLNFVYATLLTILFTLIVMILSKRNMDKIDMVESLKSVE
ncbi:FtsX-like permease family protein [Helcococcus kunzii]|uniref:FtsX-like permease family protein n=1 Tax=Helcococcus kunzii TaxID=40091 RepID=UPI0024AC8EE4|nr:FtsX-like permease family protein [Helcococcus kunzii]